MRLLGHVPDHRFVRVERGERVSPVKEDVTARLLQQPGEDLDDGALPEPLGPSRPRTSPVRTSNETFWMAVKAP